MVGGGDLGYMEERWPLSEERISIPEGYDHPLTQKYLDAVDDEVIPFLTDVYHIEVEDFHTYYVGHIGIWVHNTKAAGEVYPEYVSPKDLQAKHDARIKVPDDSPVYETSYMNMFNKN